MAQVKAAPTTNSEFKEADGFLNISVTDKNGKSHSLRKGAPLREEDGQLQKMLLADPELITKLQEGGRVTLTVVHANAKDEPIELF